MRINILQLMKFGFKQSKANGLILAVFCLIQLPFSMNAQYSESFSTPNKGYLLNCANDITAINWFLTPWDTGGTCQPADLRDPADYFSTTAAGVLESSDLDQEVCWESPLLNISTAGTVSLAVDLSWAGFDTDAVAGDCIGDYIRVSYSVNGGSYTMVANQFGGNACGTIAYPFGSTPPPLGTGTVTQGGISGTTLKIRVCVFTNVTAEVVTIDNVSVPQAGVTTGCAAPILSALATQVGCSNPNSGSIDLSVSGGTPGYTYDWSNNGPQNPDTDPQDLIGIPVGSYTVTVTDAASCSATTSVAVTAAPPITRSTQVLNTNCPGSSDGEIDLIVSGGVPGYTYDWSNNGAQNPDTDPQDLIGIPTGTYTVTITDASGCTSTTSTVVSTLPATAYLEQFNIADKGYLPNFMDDFSAVNWTMSSWAPQPPAAFGRDNADFFRTGSGVLRGEDFDQEVCWTSPLIGMNTATQFSVELAWTNFDNEDYINVKYSIDGGVYVTKPNVVGGGAGTIQYPLPTLDQSNSTTVSQAGLSGSTIQIQICGSFNDNNESMTIDNVSIPNSTTYCPAPEISLAQTNVTCAGGNNGIIMVTATGGLQPYNVSWSGVSGGNPGGTEIATSGGSYNITNLATGMYSVTVTDANALTAVANTTLNALNPATNASFEYPQSGYCQGGLDPLPQIFGNTGGTFSAPPQVSINSSSGLIDVSASTAGGPYTVTYTTSGPCSVMATFAVSIVNCQPGTTLSDNIIIDNGALAKADPGDRIRLTATISNAQTANYEGLQLTLNNDPRVTFVSNSFKTTPVAVDDSYTATMNIQLIIAAGSGILQNDFDENIPGISVTAFDMTSAQGGTVSVNPNGSFTYNPPNGFTGNDSFNYTISDSDLQTNSATVKIRVQ